MGGLMNFLEQNLLKHIIIRVLIMRMVLRHYIISHFVNLIHFRIKALSELHQNRIPLNRSLNHASSTIVAVHPPQIMEDHFTFITKVKFPKTKTVTHIHMPI